MGRDGWIGSLKHSHTRAPLCGANNMCIHIIFNPLFSEWARSIKLCPLHLRPNHSLGHWKKRVWVFLLAACFWLCCQNFPMQMALIWSNSSENTIVGIAEIQIQQNAQSVESCGIDSEAHLLPQCNAGRWVDEVPGVSESSLVLHYYPAYFYFWLPSPLSISSVMIYIQPALSSHPCIF